jgi:hypothetical protein
MAHPLSAAEALEPPMLREAVRGLQAIYGGN